MAVLEDGSEVYCGRTWRDAYPILISNAKNVFLGNMGSISLMTCMSWPWHERRGRVCCFRGIRLLRKISRIERALNRRGLSTRNVLTSVCCNLPCAAASPGRFAAGQAVAAPPAELPLVRHESIHWLAAQFQLIFKAHRPICSPRSLRHRALQWNHAARTRVPGSRPTGGFHEPWHLARTLGPAGAASGPVDALARGDRLGGHSP